MGDLSSPRNALERWLWPGLRGRLKEAAGRAEDAGKQLRSILANVSDCYFTLNGAYRITDLNEAAVDWEGRTRTGSWAHACGTCAILMPSAAA
jgi:PAS domain-containing protein